MTLPILTLFLMPALVPEPMQLLSQDVEAWVRKEVGSTGITATLPPSKPAPVQSSKLENATQSLRQFEAQSVDVGDFSIVFQRATSAPSRATTSKAVADATIEKLREGGAFANLEVEQYPLVVSGKQATKIVGKGEREGKDMGLMLLIVVEGNRLWQISAVYDASVNQQASIAKRVIDSVQIKS